MIKPFNLFLWALAVLAVIAASYLLRPTATPAHQKVSGALQGLEHWGESRIYPAAQLPKEAHFSAYDISRHHFKTDAGNSQKLASWEAIGPHNIGGRTLAIALNPQNPNTIYAGSASGGLWRSYTAGKGAAAWERVATGFPVLGVSSITFAPDDSNTIYIGTGEVYNYQTAGTGAAYRSTRGSYGIGILKSTDGGETWQKSLDWTYNQQHGVWAIKINPLNINSIWAATTEGVYHSSDAGENWNRKHDVIMANDLVIHPADTNIVVVSCGNFASVGHGIYRSTDAGDSWNKISGGVPATFRGKAMLSMSVSNPDIIYASFGSGFLVNGPNNASWLCRSDDAGATWAIQSTTDYSRWQGWFAHDCAVNPINPDEIMAIGIRIWKSIDGGITLTEQSSSGGFRGAIPPGDPEGPASYTHADHHDVVYHPTRPSTIYFANDGGIFCSEDGGETFQGRNGGYQTAQFYSGFTISQQDSNFAMGGLQDNNSTIYRGTTTWEKFVIGGDGGWAVINPADDNRVYGSWQSLNMRRSNDRGIQFTANVTPPTTGGPTSFIAPFVVFDVKQEILYAGRDKVYKSTDSGTNWTAMNSGLALDGNPILTMVVSPNNFNIVYAATAPLNGRRSGIFRTLDAGDTWTNVTGILPDRYPGDLAVDPIDGKTVYITFNGFGSSHIYRSEDAGDSWVDIDNGLPDVPSLAIVVDPKFRDHLYIGNDLGVYASTDRGLSWNTYSEGLPEAVLVYDLTISSSNRKLMMATHGNGVYQRGLLDEPVAITQNETPLHTFHLKGNFPNPFNPVTTIAFSLAEAEAISVTVYNMLGQEVARLIDNDFRSAGDHQIQWNGKNHHGNPVASGNYIYRLDTKKQSQNKVMTLSR